MALAASLLISVGSATGNPRRRFASVAFEISDHVFAKNNETFALLGK